MGVSDCKYVIWIHSTNVYLVDMKEITMKIILVLVGLLAFTVMSNNAYAGGCSGGYHTHSSDSSDKKKKSTGI